MQSLLSCKNSDSYRLLQLSGRFDEKKEVNRHETKRWRKGRENRVSGPGILAEHKNMDRDVCDSRLDISFELMVSVHLV